MNKNIIIDSYFRVMNQSSRILDLESKTKISNIIIRNSLTKSKRPAIVWTDGYSSAVLLDIIRKICLSEDLVEPPVIVVNKGKKNDQEIELVIQFLKKMDYEHVISKNQDLDGIFSSELLMWKDLERDLGTELNNIHFTREYQGSDKPLNTQVKSILLENLLLNRMLEEYRIDLLLLGRSFSHSTLDTIFEASISKPQHSRTYPIQHFAQGDIHTYLSEKGLDASNLEAILYREEFINSSLKNNNREDKKIQSERTDNRVFGNKSKDEIEDRLRRLGYM